MSDTLGRRNEQRKLEYASRIERAKSKLPKLNAQKFVQDIDEMENTVNDLFVLPLSIQESSDKLRELLKVIRKYKIK